MSTLLKMIILVLSLGIDTFLISTSLGALKTKGKFKIAIVFACAEAIMPLIGLAVGKGAGILVGNWASLIGGLLLLDVAMWLLFFEDEEEEEEKLERNLVGWTLIITAASISILCQYTQLIIHPAELNSHFPLMNQAYNKTRPPLIYT